MRYEDFIVHIVRGGESGHTVLASFGEQDGKGDFIPPYPPQDAGPDLNEPEPGSPPMEVGERLFKSLFQGEVLSLYKECLAGLEDETGFRLKLKLDPREPDLAAFQAYPWELMREPGTPDSLALSRRHSLVRFLAIPRSIPAHRRPQRLRILPVVSSPLGLEPLELERELSNLKKAVASAPGVELAEPAEPTLSGLSRALSRQECHVLHFMGHGEFDEKTSQGHLHFETETGTSMPVTGTGLINVLADFPSLRLVVLNACKSARAVGPGDVHPFGGVATTLVMGGMPAAVAMQQSIWDDLAVPFSRAFYTALAAGEPIDVAMVAGRRALHEINPGGFEWAIPVLFMRTPSGVLFPSKAIRFGWRRAVPWLLAAALGLAATAGAWWLRVDSLVHQGSQLYEHSDYGGASERFESALALAPFSAEIHSDLAGSEYRLAHSDAAEAHFRKAVDLRPDDTLHVYNLGSFLNEKKRFEEAHGLLRAAVQRHVESPGILGELGLAAMERGFLGEAREALTKAVRTEPETLKSATWRRLLGEVALRQGRPREAVGHFLAALDCCPRDTSASRLLTLSLLLRTYDGLRDTRSACRVADELRMLDPRGIGPEAESAEPVLARLDCGPPRSSSRRSSSRKETP